MLWMSLGARIGARLVPPFSRFLWVQTGLALARHDQRSRTSSRRLRFQNECEEAPYGHARVKI